MVPELLMLLERRFDATVTFHPAQTTVTEGSTIAPGAPPGEWEPIYITRNHPAYYEIRFGGEWPDRDLPSITAQLEADGILALGLPFEWAFRLYPESYIDGEAELQVHVHWVPIEWRWLEAMGQIRLFPGDLQYTVKGAVDEIDDPRRRLGNIAIHLSGRDYLEGVTVEDPEYDRPYGMVDWAREWFADFSPYGHIRFGPVVRGRHGYEFDITAIPKVGTASALERRSRSAIAPFDSSRSPVTPTRRVRGRRARGDLRGKFTPGHDREPLTLATVLVDALIRRV